MIQKIKAGSLVLTAVFLHYLSLYGVNYKKFLSDLTYKNYKKTKKIVKKIKG